MTSRLKLALAALLTVGALTFSAPAASAMPAAGKDIVNQAGPAASVEQTRWVCNFWGQCWWRPTYRYYGFYGYHRRHYWHRHYGHRHYWHRRHWHRRYW